ncbi:alpha/beta fold hydrolase [Williamsia sp. 1135]|uniref:alpha/beta hydrolase n=1 Tax=Williamsia sp. 1135 TaxID=1889262 RepID=UPI00143A90AF|nr:alpha/beta fold hydrolase [Williamsia sp. 1135]
MPLVPTSSDTEPALYYRHWPAEQPRATVVLLHGIGESSNLYHRLAFALAAEGISTYAIDQPGHGLSSGERGQAAPIAELAQAGARLIEHARTDFPLVVIGHSLGATAATVIADETLAAIDGLVISGGPLASWEPQGELELTPEALSADPFYVDQLINDPFGLPEPDLTVFFGQDLPAPWGRLTGPLPVKTIVLHGGDDPVVPVSVARSFAQIAGADLIVYPGIRHDLLNDVGHAEVAGDIVEFVLGLQE